LVAAARSRRLPDWRRPVREDFDGRTELGLVVD
jgi:hypothetical protein